MLVYALFPCSRSWLDLIMIIMIMIIGEYNYHNGDHGDLDDDYAFNNDLFAFFLSTGASALR